MFAHEKVDQLALRYLRIQAGEANLAKWAELVHRVYNPKDEVTIGIVGKYVEYEDSYKSLKEALVHGALAHNLKLNVDWIEAEGLESKDQARRKLQDRFIRARSRRIRKAWHRRHAEGHSVRPRKSGALLWDLPWHADGVH